MVRVYIGGNAVGYCLYCATKIHLYWLLKNYVLKILLMYFILSKVLIFLLYPTLWIFVLLLIALLSKNAKRKQRFLVASVALLYIFTVPVFINFIAGVWSVGTGPIKANKVYSCAIVLGGFSSADKNGNGYFNGAADRFIQGLMALKTGKVSHLMITGGTGNLIDNKFKEGNWVKQQLDSLQIPDSSVLIESNSRNTIENASFSKPILQKAGLKPPYLLITSDFHMRRAAMIFRKQGYDIVPYPADHNDSMSGFYFDDLIPDGNGLGAWNIYFKEMVGYVVDRFK